MNKLYYDACIFQASANDANRNSEHCRNITNPAKIDWVVVFSREIIISECPVSEILDAFEVQCGSTGVVYECPSLSEAKQAARQRRAEKKALRQLGFGGNDWNHLCAADFARCHGLISDDSDFFDPKNKASPKSKVKGSAVKDHIHSTFGLKVMTSSDCAARCR